MNTKKKIFQPINHKIFFFKYKFEVNNPHFNYLVVNVKSSLALSLSLYIHIDKKIDTLFFCFRNNILYGQSSD